MRTVVAIASLSLAGCVPATSTSPIRPISETGSSSLYMPRAVQQAYQKGTRSPDGRPGRNYWQNRARYNIAITALPPDRTIRGSEEITYFNNSPDTIRTPVIRLFLNIHKPGAPRGGGAGADYLTAGMRIDSLKVNGRPTPWTGNERPYTWHRLALPAPLAPHDSVRLSFKWHYDISKDSNREGMTDSTTWFLAYFYPRVAVFDDYNGWDTMDFTDGQEFYSDFNDYDVAITVPRNFVVWGTGTLLNPAEVLQPTHLKRFTESLTSDQTIHIATKAELSAKTVTAQAPRNTWRFRAANISDMAFNLSDHYVWDAASVVVDGSTRRRASVQAAYNDTAADYRHMVRFGRNALDWFSRNWPGLPYPYEKTTIVQGPAGMEYPMMANDESYADTVFSKFVAEHEIVHTWFPFYMGINESRYPFMDEGWATALEYLINTVNLGPERATQFFQQFRVSGWFDDPSPLADFPIIAPADGLGARAWGDNAYGKAALGYLALKDLLGDAKFRQGLHAFIDRWKGKHPTPWDMFNTFNDVTGQNLNWFWNRWFFTNNYIDLAISDVTRTGSGYTVSIENIGGMPAPVDLRATFGDGTSEVIHQTPAVWAADARRAQVAIPTRKPLQSVVLNGGIWMDADSTNNRWTAGTSSPGRPQD